MHKAVYVLVWSIEKKKYGVDGYFNRTLTEPEQHAYLRKNYPSAYNSGGPCFISWSMVELKGQKILPGLPDDQWSA